MSFNIVFQEGKFRLIESQLEWARKAYLESYLEKISRYQFIGTHQGSPVISLYQPPPATPAGVRALNQRLTRRFEQSRKPATATLSLTKACQCDCLHCSAVYYNHNKRQDLSTDAWLEALRQTVHLGVSTIILLGGEPLLRKDIFKLVESVPKNQAQVILFTNGEYLTPKNCEKLKRAGLMGAYVSLDSANAKEHDLGRRRDGLFDRAIAGISNLKNAGLIAGISSYLSHSRLANGGFEEMLELGQKIDAAEITFFDAIPTGPWLFNPSDGLTFEDRKKINQMVQEARKSGNVPGLSVQSTMTSECGSAFCFAANTQFYLTAFGDMCPCDFTPLTIGKFPEESIETLWNKMIGSAPYNQRAKSCRMQDSEFRKNYIERIPKTGPFPYPLELL